MFSRAFTSFIDDKIESQGRKSEFLSYGSKNILYDWRIDDVDRLRAAQNRMSVEQLTEFLKLLKNTPRKQATGEVQDDLFGFDDSAIRTAETLSKLATKKIREINAKIRAADGAVKNPEGAKKLNVNTGKNADKLLKAAKEEAARWEHWHTDPELYQQLMKEAGLANEESSAPNGESSAPNGESSAPAQTTQENTQENTPTTQDTEGGLFDAPAAETKAPEPAPKPQPEPKAEQKPTPEPKEPEKAPEEKPAVVKENLTTQEEGAKGKTQEEILSAVGDIGRLWEKGGHHRLYLSPWKIRDRFGLEMDKRDNAYIDLTTGEVVCKSPDVKKAVKDLIRGPAEQVTTPTPATAPEAAEVKNTPAPPVQGDLQKALREVIEVDADGRVKQQRLLRLAKQFGISEKEIQEKCEGEVVNMAREINARKDLSDGEKFEALLQLYNKQPNFGKRTSTSVANQAYSTPAPLAWLLGKRIGLEGRSVYEPTAGTGMLTISGNPATIDVNEIDVVRKGILSGQGFRRLTDKDASKNRPNRTYDRVIMNPPFDGAEKTDFDGYALSKLDHIIAARALETLAPDGRAAIIVGANTEHRDGSGRTNFPDFVFMGYLYSHFNVADNFIVSGDLYKKQGASPPIRIITLNGRKTDTKSAVEVPKRFEILGNWDTLYENLKGELQNEVSEPGRSADAREGLPGAGQERQSAADNERSAAGSQESLGADRGRSERGSRSAGRSGEVDEQQSERNGSLGTDQSQGRQLSRPAESGNNNGGRVGNGTEDLARRTPDAGNRTGTVADSGRSSSAGSESALRPAGQSQRSAEPSRRVQVGEKRGELNNTYLPASQSKDHMDVVVPRFMAEAVENSLRNIAGQVGDVDRFVQTELGYGTPDELYAALSDVQIDGVAQAITAVQNGDGFVLGDQTGIGKGRQCAAMIRWAQHRGITPIFLTKDQNLFTDMYRDGKDIGSVFNPLIVASDGDKADITDQDGKKIVRIPKNQAKAFNEMLAKKSPYDCIFVPYSQLQKEGNKQQMFLRELVTTRKCLLIMDEAHEASGDSARGRFFYGSDGLLHQNEVGVIYASATFAKRPDNMALYFRTNIRKAVDSIDDLKDILAKGGVPLQQLLSSGLAQDGQYTRRERDFTGVKFDTVVAEPQGGNGEISAKQELIEKYDRVADVLGRLVEHSERIKKAVNKAERENYGSANTREKTSIQTASFSSVTHNYISQLLLATKCDIIVDEAEKAFKAGQKPVIALTNTLESVLRDFVESAGIAQGDPVTMKFSDILESALNRMYSYNQKLGKGNEIRVNFSPEKYGLTAAHERMLEAIHDLDDLDLPVSPIDYIKQQLEKRGIRTGEITGRELTVNYSGPVPVLEKRGTKEQNKNRNVNAFNSGETDAIILNASGSTGLSLHSSAKFADRKQRHMIMAQPSLDIAIVQQMFGRVLRSGQVNSPTYTILSSPLAAERRPMMVLGRKLQSLNANTTANNKGAVSLGLDFMNKYGDVVAQQYLNDNPEVAALLDLDTDSAGEDVTSAAPDLMVKLTGRMAILSDQQQQEILDDLTARYTDMVDFLKKTGNYDLEITVHDDWDAKTLEESEVVSGVEEGSIFQQPVTLKKINIKEQRNIREAKEVRGEIDSNLGSTVDALSEKLNEDFARAERAIENLEKTYAEGEAEPELIRNRKILLRRMMDNFKRFIRDSYRTPLELTIGEDSYAGVVTGYRITGKFNPRSPIIASKLMIDVAVSDTIGKITIPFSRFQKRDVQVTGSVQTLDELFTGEKRAVRSDRYAVTGNLLRGLEYTDAGKIVSYKTAEGNVETALLLPKLWEPKHMVRDPRNEINSVDEAISILNGPSGIVRSGDGLEIIRRYGSTYLSVPKAKRKGGKYFLDRGLLAITGDFTSYGSQMRTEALDDTIARKAISYILGMKDTFLKKDSSEGRQYSIQHVYTGSAADYDKPSLHYVGTGEGAQVYGWGLYGSSSEDVARWYAQNDAERKGYSSDADVSIDGQQIERDPIRLPFTTEGFAMKQVREAVIKAEGNIDQALSFLRSRLYRYADLSKNGPGKARKSFQGELEIIQKAIVLLENHNVEYNPAPITGRRNLYQQTFWPGKEENLLDWDKEVPESQMRQIIEMAEKEDHILTYVIPDNKKMTGEEIYKLLSAYPRSPKAASEFLYRAGIDGITYIGNTSGVRNYVAFSDQDVQVDNHLQYSLKRGEAIWDNKKADELLPFRDLARGFRLDKKSEAAVRQSILNITQLPEEVKSKFIDFWDNWIKRKPIPGLNRPLDVDGFATSLGVLGFEREGSSSTYKTLNGNTIRVAHHSATMETFLKDNRPHDNVVSVVVENPNIRKKFRSDERVDGVEYVFPASDLEAHPGKLGLIIHDIAQFFATGTYVDHAGAKYFHTSGTEGFRTDAQKRFDEEKKAREQAYDAVSKLRAGDEAESTENTENTEEDDGNSHIQYSLVRDPKRLRRLKAEEERGEYITLYRAAQLVDGKLYPPMAAKINGEWVDPIVLGKWEQADEHPELATDDGYFRLNKGNGSSVDARYNPYFHSSPSPLNDQFSSAYKRPELVTLEVRVPKSELTSGYHAEKAKDPVGMLSWHAGTVQKQRQVMLSRWDKPIRIIPDSEIAGKIKELLQGRSVAIPANVLTPSLRKELEKIGVPVTDGKEYSLKKRQQMNPIREPGPIRDEYQARLDNSTYTPRSNAEVNRLAARRIANLGGMAEAARMVADGELTGTTDVGQRVMQLVLNSPEFKALDVDERDRISDRYEKIAGTETARALAARRLGVLKLDDITSVQAHINALLAKLDKIKPKNTLREDILKEFGVDIDALPDDIVSDPGKLDEIVRKLAAQRANIWDKLYEFWINSILSGPTTHGANTLGNVSNAVYELGLKRFAEAAVNLAAFFQYSAKSPKVRSRGESFTGMLSKVTTLLRPTFMMLSGIS